MEPGLSGPTPLSAYSSLGFAMAISHLPGNYLSSSGRLSFLEEVRPGVTCVGLAEFEESTALPGSGLNYLAFYFFLSK